MLTVFDKFPLAKKYHKEFIHYGLIHPLVLAHFFAQAKHESNLLPKSESLNYRNDKLIPLFGNHRIGTKEANEYGRIENSKGKIIQLANQEMIANIVYGREWGFEKLGNILHGDGWKYRGRGWFQITGLWNYRKLTYDTGIDFVNNPDLLLQEKYSVIAALWYWNKNKLTELALKDNLDAISDIINKGKITKPIGDSNGFKDREIKLKEFKKIFQIAA